MLTNRPRRRRVAALTTAVAAVTPTAGLLTGCEGTDNSLDCHRNATVGPVGLDHQATGSS